MRRNHFQCFACTMLAATLFTGGVASASVVGFDPNQDFAGNSATFGYLGQSFTLSDNGSGFPSTVSAATAGTAMLAKDFFGISVFFDPPRNTLIFDSGLQYAGFPTATVLSFSSLPTIIGLALTAGDGIHYGYAEFSGTLLQSYAFESVAGVGISALAPITAGVPEPSELALICIGALALVSARRARRASKHFFNVYNFEAVDVARAGGRT